MPTFTSGEPFSASKMNDVSRTLRTLKAVADMERVPFREVDGAATGYIQHAFDTLDYTITGGTFTVTYAGQSIGNITGDANFDLSTLGTPPTVGQVYAVVLTVFSGSPVLRYMAERFEPAYVAPPTFTNGVTLTAANLNSVADRTDTLINLGNANPASMIFTTNDNTSWNREDDTIFTVWRGWLRHTGDDVVFRVSHDAESVLTPTMTSVFELYVNGTRAVRRLVNDPIPSGWDITSYGGGAHNPGGNRSGEHIRGTADLSSLGLTLGTVYLWEVKQEGTGTSKTMDLHMRLNYIATSASGASWSDLPTWAHAGQNVSAARLTLYSTAINRLYPGSGSEVSPLYYDNQAQFVFDSDDKRYMRKTQKFLIYRWTGTTTSRPEITSNPIGSIGIKHALRAETGNQWADLDRVQGLGYGDFFFLDDCDYAQQTDDVSLL
ncbi:MAG: hypothetical protein V3R81_02580 [Gammaproteobacteria bacterium]